jgi:hypothetical protein
MKRANIATTAMERFGASRICRHGLAVATGSVGRGGSSQRRRGMRRAVPIASASNPPDSPWGPRASHSSRAGSAARITLEKTITSA